MRAMKQAERDAKEARKQAKQVERNKEAADKERALRTILAAEEEVHYPTLPLRVEQSVHSLGL